MAQVECPYLSVNVGFCPDMSAKASFSSFIFRWRRYHIAIAVVKFFGDYFLLNSFFKYYFCKKQLAKNYLLLNISYICIATGVAIHIGEAFSFIPVDESPHVILALGISKGVLPLVLYICTPLHIQPKV